MITTNVKVRGSTNGISNKYSVVTHFWVPPQKYKYIAGRN